MRLKVNDDVNMKAVLLNSRMKTHISATACVHRLLSRTARIKELVSSNVEGVVWEVSGLKVNAKIKHMAADPSYFELDTTTAGSEVVLIIRLTFWARMAIITRHSQAEHPCRLDYGLRSE